MGVTHRLRLSLACAVLFALTLCSSSLAQDPASTPTPDGPCPGRPEPVVDPAATVTPEPTPTPAPRRGSERMHPNVGGTATPSPSEREPTLPARAPHERDAGRRRLRRRRPGSSPTGLALVIGGGALALFTTAFAARRGRARRRQEEPAPKSALEMGSLLVAICGGVTALLSTMAPGLTSHERPPPQATMVVRDVNSRITLGEFASAVGAKPPPARSARSWATSCGSSCGSRASRPQAGAAVGRLRGRRRRRAAARDGASDRSAGRRRHRRPGRRTQPVRVRYPKVDRFRVLFRLLDRARVQEMARSPAMTAEERYACGRRA